MSDDATGQPARVTFYVRTVVPVDLAPFVARAGELASSPFPTHEHAREIEEIGRAIEHAQNHPVYHYERVEVRTPSGYTHYLDPAPLIGDMVLLSSASYRILDRMWAWPVWGSHDWPLGERGPDQGPLLDYIVERCDGMFANEAPVPLDEDVPDGT